MCVYNSPHLPPPQKKKTHGSQQHRLKGKRGEYPYRMTPKLRGLSKESPLDFHGGTEDETLPSGVGVPGSIPGPGRFRMLRSYSHAPPLLELVSSPARKPQGLTPVPRRGSQLSPKPVHRAKEELRIAAAREGPCARPKINTVFWKSGTLATNPWIILLNFTDWVK